MAKIKTTKISGGAEYAKVADRLKLFWEQNPNGKIATVRENLKDNKIRFVARIWRNKEEVIELAKAGVSLEIINETASSTGSADAIKKGDKENEKLETVAVGRALANLGYLASGEVASREEMEAFEEYKAEKSEKALAEAMAKINKAKSLAELQKAFTEAITNKSFNKKQLEEIIKAKDEVKGKLA